MLDTTLSCNTRVSQSGGAIRRTSVCTHIRIMHYESNLANDLFRNHAEDVVQVAHLFGDWIAVEFFPSEGVK